MIASSFRCCASPCEPSAAIDVLHDRSSTRVRGPIENASSDPPQPAISRQVAHLVRRSTTESPTGWGPAGDITAATHQHSDPCASSLWKSGKERCLRFAGCGWRQGSGPCAAANDKRPASRSWPSPSRPMLARRPCTASRPPAGGDRTPTRSSPRTRGCAGPPRKHYGGQRSSCPTSSKRPAGQGRNAP